MGRFIIRSVATAVSIVGVILLGRVIFMLADGSLVAYVFEDATPSEWMHASAVALALPVPLHVIAIGLILQRRWLSAGWSKFAWTAIVISGLWLGAALMVKLIIRN